MRFCALGLEYRGLVAQHRSIQMTRGRSIRKIQPIKGRAKKNMIGRKTNNFVCRDRVPNNGQKLRIIFVHVAGDHAVDERSERNRAAGSIPYEHVGRQLGVDPR
jgi:hypothetical protein